MKWGSLKYDWYTRILSKYIVQRSSWTLNGSSRPSLSTPRHFQDERLLVDDHRSVTVSGISGESIVTTLKSIFRTATRFTDTRKLFERFSKRHFKSNNSFLEEEMTSDPFFLPSQGSPGFLLKNTGRSMPFGTLSRCDNSKDNREDYRK